jgi:hypothetical protein
MRIRKEEDRMKPHAMDRCVFCAYVVQLRADRTAIPAPLAVEVVATPNGPRPLCALHARDAVRA